MEYAGGHAALGYAQGGAACERSGGGLQLALTLRQSALPCNDLRFTRENSLGSSPPSLGVADIPLASAPSGAIATFRAALSRCTTADCVAIE